MITILFTVKGLKSADIGSCQNVVHSATAGRFRSREGAEKYLESHGWVSQDMNNCVYERGAYLAHILDVGIAQRLNEYVQMMDEASGAPNWTEGLQHS